MMNNVLPSEFVGEHQALLDFACHNTPDNVQVFQVNYGRFHIAYLLKQADHIPLALQL
jgi:hypothetical protein